MSGRTARSRMASSSDPRSEGLIIPDWAEELPAKWCWHQLDGICLEIVDCPHSTPEIVDAGPCLMARTSDILTGVFRAREARRVSERTYLERTRRAEPTYGDLLYSREGTYFGFSAEVPPDTKVCLGQRMVLLRPDAVQLQPVPAVMVALAVLAAATTFCVVGATLKLHAALWVTVTVCPATVKVPVRAVVAVLAATE
jgi:hypothetical protein